MIYFTIGFKSLLAALNQDTLLYIFGNRKPIIFFKDRDILLLLKININTIIWCSRQYRSLCLFN